MPQRNCYRKDKYFCPKCKKRHHVSIWKTPTGDQSVSASTNKIDMLKSNFVHLPTALKKYALHPPPPTDISGFEKNKRLKLADPDDSLSYLPIEILIGADFYWNVMNSEPPVNLSNSLILVPSIFGYILSGSRSHATISFVPTVHNINVDTSTQALDEVLREIWRLESIGTQPIQEKKKKKTPVTLNS
ncbi:uncharacterized protein NPIL_180211 [Nephila pilipes]|uniref:Peptidase aspartic putative domain-containing protein n=1 Tax=Nephila pilipes TaxID=299642 RepID=A0A8X6NQS6_NEPPI|nr:uncharacterized protein NPIL_180211 [Nephila pilipes]